MNSAVWCICLMFTCVLAWLQFSFAGCAWAYSHCVTVVASKCLSHSSRWSIILLDLLPSWELPVTDEFVYYEVCRLSLFNHIINQNQECLHSSLKWYIFHCHTSNKDWAETVHSRHTLSNIKCFYSTNICTATQAQLTAHIAGLHNLFIR